MTITDSTQYGCINNQTPYVAADDYFTLDVAAELHNGTAADTFEVVLNAAPDGAGGTVLGQAAHAQTIRVGFDKSLAAGNQSYPITVRSKARPDCFSVFYTDPVPVCSSCPAAVCLPGEVQLTRTFD